MPRPTDKENHSNRQTVNPVTTIATRPVLQPTAVNDTIALRERLQTSEAHKDNLEAELRQLREEHASLKAKSAVATRRRKVERDDDDTAILHSAKAFTILHEIWMPKNQNPFVDSEEEVEYDPSRRYDDPVQRCCGIRRDLQTVIPQSLQHHMSEEWFSKQFQRDMGTQRHDMVNRIRTTTLPLIFPDMPGDDERRRLIGFDARTRTYEAMAPILAPPGSRKVDKFTMFRNPVLFNILRGAFFGPSSIKKKKTPRCAVLAHILKLNHVTPGSIAATGVLVRYALSDDTTFSEIGPQTGIPYAADYQKYKKILDLGEDSPHVQSLMKDWNNALFPMSTTSQHRMPALPATPSTSVADQLLQSLYDIDEEASGANDRAGPNDEPTPRRRTRRVVCDSDSDDSNGDGGDDQGLQPSSGPRSTGSQGDRTDTGDGSHARDRVNDEEAPGSQARTNPRTTEPSIPPPSDRVDPGSAQRSSPRKSRQPRARLPTLPVEPMETRKRKADAELAAAGVKKKKARSGR